MEIKKLSPWNWFKNEESQQSVDKPVSLPTQQYERHPIARLHTEIDRLFEDTFRGLNFGMPSLFERAGLSEMGGMLKPVVDIAENDKNYVITVEVPGVDEKDIQVSQELDVLTIRGEKNLEQEHKDDNFHRVERSYGTFQRVLTLPVDADADSVKATFKNGVLTLTIDKQPEMQRQGRKIEIEHA
jgi:HSP20 family protein